MPGLVACRGFCITDPPGNLGPWALEIRDGHHPPQTGIRDTDIHHVNEEVEHFFSLGSRMTRFFWTWNGLDTVMLGMDEPTASKENSQ